MHLKHVKGNLITLAENGEFNIIVHGCNCFNTMGSGIALEMRQRYPKVYEVDCTTGKGDRNKLGTYSFAATAKFLVINAYTQFDFNRQGERNDVFEYTAFKLILEKLAHLSGSNNFGFPYIGMGKAGGDTDKIMAMLEEFAEKISAKGGTVTLVQFH